MTDIQNEPYYHGLLPREDVICLLTKPGNFLIRIAQPTANAPRQNIVSICVGSRLIKHFVVKDLLVDGKCTYTVDEKTYYSSIQELVNCHKSLKRSLSEQIPSAIPRHAVGRAPWELSHSHISMEKKLGEGAFGEVWLGALKSLHPKKVVKVAIKEAKCKNTNNKEKINEILKEARLMRKFAHENVVKLYGVAVQKEPLLIVMEFVSGGALDSYLKKNNCGITEKLQMSYGAALGVEYLHSRNCIHRDLAARNCLYDISRTEPKVKIADFGLSREGTVYQVKKAAMLPIRWLAPETLATLLYTPKSDVWSFGVIVWEIFANGEEPYPGSTNRESKANIEKGVRNVFHLDCPVEVSSFVCNSIWAINPTERPSMTQVASMFGSFGGGHAQKSCHIEPYFVDAKQSPNMKAITPAQSAVVRPLRCDS